MTSIHTAAELVDALGGEDAVARACDVPSSQVRIWMEAEFPRGFHLFLFARAIIAGRTFGPIGMHRLFGLQPADAEAFCKSIAIVLNRFPSGKDIEQ